MTIYAWESLKIGTIGTAVSKTSSCDRQTDLILIRFNTEEAFPYDSEDYNFTLALIIYRNLIRSFPGNAFNIFIVSNSHLANEARVVYLSVELSHLYVAR